MANSGSDNQGFTVHSDGSGEVEVNGVIVDFEFTREIMEDAESEGGEFGSIEDIEWEFGIDAVAIVKKAIASQ